MQVPLPINPLPERHVFLVLLWHETIAILSFKLDKLFKLLVPFLFIRFRHDGSQLLFVVLCCFVLPFAVYRY
jgi:hypothetical protein